MVSSNLVLFLFFLVINCFVLWRKWMRVRLIWFGGKLEERFKFDRNGCFIFLGEKSNLYVSWINCFFVLFEIYLIL